MSASARRPPVRIGSVYGRLTAVAEAERDSKRPKEKRWRVRCACGNEVVVRSDHLAGGRTTSCGCSRRKATACPTPPPPPMDEAASVLSLRIIVTPDDRAVLRALALAEAHDPDDPAAVLVRLLREAGQRRGLHHIVNRGDPAAVQRASRTHAMPGEKARAGAETRRRNSPSKAERGAFRAAAIEAGA